MLQVPTEKKSLKTASMVSNIGAKFFYCAIAIYLIGTVNFLFYEDTNWHDQQRFGQGLLVLLVLLSWWANLAAKRERTELVIFIPRLTIISFAAFGFIGAISALMAEFPRWALLEWASILSLMLCTIFIASFRFDGGMRFDRVLIAICATACTIYLVGCIARYLTIFNGLDLDVWSLFEGFANIRFFGHFQTMTLPLLALPIIYARSVRLKVLAFILLGGWWMLAIASGTRGTWLAMFVAILVVYVLCKKIGREWIRLQICGAALGIAAYCLLFFAIPYGFGLDLRTVDRLPNLFGLSNREILWWAALHIIEKSPLLGAGPMHFGVAPTSIGGNPHNALLQIACEWGVPATLLLAGTVFSALWKFAKSFSASSRGEPHTLLILRVALFASLLGAGVQSMVDGIIVMPYSQTLLVLMIGWSMGLYSSTKPDLQKATMNGSIRFAIISFFAVGLMCIVIWASAPEAIQLQEREQAYITRNGGLFSPRFWLQGRIHPIHWSD